MKDPQFWQAVAAVIAAFAALFGGIYAVVTKPIISRLERIEAILDRIEKKLESHGDRITTLEQRGWR